MWLKIKLYLVTLIPLFVMVIITKINVHIFNVANQFIGWKAILQNNPLPVISLIFILLGFLFILSFNYEIKGGLKNPMTITDIDNINFEHLTFLATYIIPLIDFDLNSLRYLIDISFLLILIGIIFIKTNLYYANPTLALFGFHIYRATTLDKKNIIFISKNKLVKGLQVFHKNLGSNVYFVKI